jgi:hypothetical protein
VDLPVLMTVDHKPTDACVRTNGEDFDFEIHSHRRKPFSCCENSVLFEFDPATPGKPKQWRVGEGKDQRIWDQVTLTVSSDRAAFLHRAIIEAVKSP